MQLVKATDIYLKAVYLQFSLRLIMKNGLRRRKGCSQFSSSAEKCKELENNKLCFTLRCISINQLEVGLALSGQERCRS